jgi:2-C-methyl-D-erythritol 2,4-cyclodiphosphate synthase
LRVGHGYDAHRLVSGRKLILGGVLIPYEKGLAGHSDADVVLHAVIDALLGAAGLGDIGGMFPDSDPAYLDADSRILLKRAFAEIRARGFAVGNIDATVIAQAPVLKPYIGQMRQNIAAACGTEPENVNVKATTEEKMGFTGNREGIAAHAVCLLTTDPAGSNTR